MDRQTEAISGRTTRSRTHTFFQKELLATGLLYFSVGHHYRKNLPPDAIAHPPSIELVSYASRVSIHALKSTLCLQDRETVW